MRNLVEPRKQGGVGEGVVRFGFISRTASCSLCRSAQAPLGSSWEFNLLIQHKTVQLFFVGMLSRVGSWREAQSTVLGAHLSYKWSPPSAATNSYLGSFTLRNFSLRISEQHTDGWKPHEKLYCRTSNNKTKAGRVIRKEKTISIRNYLYFLLYTWTKQHWHGTETVRDKSKIIP